MRRWTLRGRRTDEVRGLGRRDHRVTGDGTMTNAVLVVTPVTGVPEVHEGDDLAGLLVAAVSAAALPAVLVVSSKVVSKSSGLRCAGRRREDVVAEQTVRVVAERAGEGGPTRVVESVAGPVMAAAGVDASNTGDDALVGTLLVLPTDADAAAGSLRAGLLTRLGLPDRAPLGVVVSDTSGRPWRSGLTDFALGCAGVFPALDHRGEPDADGRVLGITVRALADELAAAADLVKGKSLRVPAAVVSGLPRAWFDPHAPGARSLVRTGPGDWFALGHVEAVRAALGVAPGSPAAQRIGLPATRGLDAFDDRVARMVDLALHTLPSAAVDVELRGDEQAHLACSAQDDLDAGMLIARLLVAAGAESLAATRTGPFTLAVSPARSP